MTAQMSQTCTLPDDPLQTAADPLEAARRHIVDTALTESIDPSAGGRVGLELEFHLVDLASPGRRPAWVEVQAIVAGLPTMPSGSSVTLEPGGQIELSTPPTADVASSVAALRADRAVLSEALRTVGFGAAPLGTDPARPIRRINPPVATSRWNGTSRRSAASPLAAR